MLLRKIILILAVLILLTGISQLVFMSWWSNVMQAFTNLTTLRLLGLVAVFMGGAILLGAVRRLVGLRLFMGILGAYVLASGFVLLASPGLMSDLVCALFVKRGSAFRVMILLFGGAIRIVIGGAMLYAVYRPPAQAQTPATPR